MADYIQADLRLLLPLQAGQTVGVYGDFPALSAALVQDRLMETAVSIQVNPINQKLDHLIVPMPELAHLDEIREWAAQAIVTNGRLFIGLPYSRQLAMEKQQLEDHFRSPTWQIEQLYGIRQDLHRPHTIVPLSNNIPSRYFHQQLLHPYSWRAVLGNYFTNWLNRWGQQRFLFKHLGLVAQRIS